MQITITTKNSHGPRTVTVHASRYVADHSPAMMLLDSNGTPFMKPTINLTGLGASPPPGCCFIKDYSENDGVLAELVRTGLVDDTGQTVQLERCVANIARLNQPFLDLLTKFDQERNAH